ncbi:MAG: hypothetical protein FJ405_18545, partial [Verrucomicrobia bacterium]|nr:hypothetical protein [Verrucomicrobiota bacterium]
ISAGGSRIMLAAPDGRRVLSELRAPEFFPGVAYGVGADDQPGYLPKPTPGAVNGPVAPHGENRVSFSHPRGFYARNFPLTLTADLPGSIIRYTLDGSLPSPTRGSNYLGPITVRPSSSGSTRGVRIVRAIAVHTNAVFAPAATATYLFVQGDVAPATDGVVSQSQLNTSITRNTNYASFIDDALLALPTLSLILGETLSSSEQAASVEFFDPENREAGFQINCGVHATGTTSLGSPKLSMAAKFKHQYGKSKLRYPVYARGSLAPPGGATEFDELRLRSHSHDTFYWLGTSENPPVPYGSPPVQRSGDAQLGRNLWIEEMQLLMGQPGKRGRQTHLYLNGAYHGIYHIQEHADEDFMASYYPGSSTDFHFSASAIGGSVHANGDSWRTTWGQLKASLGNYSQAIRWIDVTNLCDYMTLSFYAGNDWDWSTQHNWSAAGPKAIDKGGWKFFQQDSDISLQDVNADCTDKDVPDGIFTALMNHTDFRSLFRDRVYLHCFNNGVLTPGRAADLYNARMNEISTAIVAETARWQPGSSVASLPWDRNQEWTNEWNYLRTTFFPNRVSQLIPQLRAHANWWPTDPPILSELRGEVSLGHKLKITTLTSLVYYTTDGSDPRLPGGRINPAAKRLAAALRQTSLIATGTVWRFLDTGQEPGSNWIHSAFDDSAWRAGRTEIGYGDGGETTVANFVDTDPVRTGVQRNITTYFRKAFDATNAPSFDSLRLRLVRDDGAVVYLNGLEIWRTN